MSVTLRARPFRSQRLNRLEVLFSPLLGLVQMARQRNCFPYLIRGPRRRTSCESGKVTMRRYNYREREKEQPWMSGGDISKFFLSSGLVFVRRTHYFSPIHVRIFQRTFIV